jgi:hypothetical protein
MSIQAPDLTKRPPRSPRVRLGGYAILPRMLDKGRASLAGTVGEFHYNCPLDQEWTAFSGIDADKLKEQLATGKGDGEILEWIRANAHKRSAAEIHAWSLFQDQRGPGDLDKRQFFNDYHAQLAPERDDITSWFDMLDIDDFVSYGGKV